CGEDRPHPSPPLQAGGGSKTQERKSRLAPAFCFNSNRATGLRQFVDLRVEAALVAGGLVLVDQAAGGVAIHHRLGDGERGDGAGLVLGLDGLDDLLQGGADHGTCADVAQAALFGLARALLRGLDVGQGRTPECSVGVGKRRQLCGRFAIASITWAAIGGLRAAGLASRRRRGQHSATWRAVLWPVATVKLCLSCLDACSKVTSPR